MIFVVVFFRMSVREAVREFDKIIAAADKWFWGFYCYRFGVTVLFE